MNVRSRKLKRLELMIIIGIFGSNKNTQEELICYISISKVHFNNFVYFTCSIFKRLEELLSVHDGLKEQEHNFREQCKSDLNLLRDMLQEIEDGAPAEEEDRVKEYEDQKETVTRVRLQLAKKNRTIASLTRQLDDVPGRSELTQYQRRFMELYNQG